MKRPLCITTVLLALALAAASIDAMGADKKPGLFAQSAWDSLRDEEKALARTLYAVELFAPGEVRRSLVPVSTRMWPSPFESAEFCVRRDGSEVFTPEQCFFSVESFRERHKGD